MRATMGPRPGPAHGRFRTERGLPPALAVAVGGSETCCDSRFETCSKTCSKTEESLP